MLALSYSVKEYVFSYQEMDPKDLFLFYISTYWIGVTVIEL